MFIIKRESGTKHPENLDSMKRPNIQIIGVEEGKETHICITVQMERYPNSQEPGNTIKSHTHNKSHIKDLLGGKKQTGGLLPLLG